MRRDLKYLLLFYFLFVIVKSIIAYFVQGPSVFGDEYVYFKLARNFFENGYFMYHGEVVSKFPSLYPLIISIAYVFQDTNVVYYVVKVINAFLSSLIIFPAYYLLKDFLSSKKALIGTVLVGLLASNFTISNYVLSENLFYPLFLITITLVYFAFKTEKLKFFIISGLFLGLSYHTRVLATAIVPIVFLVFLFYRTKLKNIFLHYFVALLVVLPELYKHGVNYGWTIKGVLGGYKGTGYITESVSSNFLNLVNWFFLNWVYVLLAAGGIFGIYFIYGYYVKEEKFRLLYLITVLATGITALVIANQSSIAYLPYDSALSAIFSNRPVGRYLDPCMTLIFIVGFIVFEKYDVKSKLLKGVVAFSALLFFLGSQLNIVPLLPLNNQTMTIFGAIKSFFEYLFYGNVFLGSEFHWLIFIIMLLVFVSIPFFVYIFKDKKNILYYFLILFVIVNLVLSLGAIVYNNQGWDESSQENLGKWLDGYNEGTVMIVSSECEIIHTKEVLNTEICPEYGSMFGFWVNKDIVVGDGSDLEGIDYVVAMDDYYPLTVLKQDGNLFIYKVGDE